MAALQQMLLAGRGGTTSYAYDTAVLADSPAFFYDFSESSGSTLTDKTGNTRSGTYDNSGTLYGPASNTAGLLTTTRGTFNPDGVDDKVVPYRSYTGWATSHEIAISGLFKIVSSTTGRPFELNWHELGLLLLFEVNTSAPSGGNSHCRLLAKTGSGNVQVSFDVPTSTVVHLGFNCKQGDKIEVFTGSTSLGSAAIGTWARDTTTGTDNGYLGCARDTTTFSDTKMSGIAFWDGVRTGAAYGAHKTAAGL